MTDQKADVGETPDVPPRSSSSSPPHALSLPSPSMFDQYAHLPEVPLSVKCMTVRGVPCRAVTLNLAAGHAELWQVLRAMLGQAIGMGHFLPSVLCRRFWELGNASLEYPFVQSPPRKVLVTVCTRCLLVCQTPLTVVRVQAMGGTSA